MAGLDIYEAIPENKSKAKTILFVADIFGYTLPNARLLADEFAHAGFYVVVPDFLQGDPVNHNLLNNIVPRKPHEVTALEKAKNTAITAANFGPWLVKHREAVVWPLIENAAKTLREDPEIGKIGAVGYCWGGRYAVLLGSGSEPLVDAVVCNHPAMLSIPGEVEAIRRPVQFNVGDIDEMLDVKSVDTIKEVLDAKHPDVASEVNMFNGGVHGFSVRGDMEEPEERKRKEDATEKTIRWFNKHLA